MVQTEKKKKLWNFHAITTIFTLICINCGSEYKKVLENLNLPVLNIIQLISVSQRTSAIYSCVSKVIACLKFLTWSKSANRLTRCFTDTTSTFLALWSSNKKSALLNMFQNCIILLVHTVSWKANSLYTQSRFTWKIIIAFDET